MLINLPEGSNFYIENLDLIVEQCSKKPCWLMISVISLRDSTTQYFGIRILQ